MRRLVKIAIIISLLIVIIISLLLLSLYYLAPKEYITQQPSLPSQPPTEPLCPVTNSSTSFCIVKNGKPYYFAILGWELPTIEEVKYRVGGSSNLYVWLKVRTNLELEIDADNDGYVLVGELYKPVLHADTLIRRGNDTYLIQYDIPSWHEDITSLINADKVRFYFDVGGPQYYEVLPSSGCINQICFTRGRHGPGFYVNYTKPPVSLKVLSISGKRVAEELYLYNVTLELKGGYLVLYFYYDEKTGKKSHASFPIDINVYTKKDGKLLVTEAGRVFPGVVVPPLPPTSVDVWKEPEHKYIATIIPPGVFTLTFKTTDAFYPLLLFNNTPIVVGTPWGGVEVRPCLKVLDVNGYVFGTYMAPHNMVRLLYVNVTLMNCGSIPLPLPSTSFTYETYGIDLLKATINGTPYKLVYYSGPGIPTAPNGRVWGKLAFVINPGEVVTIPLTPIKYPPYEPYEDEIYRVLPLLYKGMNYKVSVISLSTNTSKTIDVYVPAIDVYVPDTR